MIDARHPNFTETLLQIDELKSIVAKLEKNLYSQLPQELHSNFTLTKESFLGWVEEIECTINDYK